MANANSLLRMRFHRFAPFRRGGNYIFLNFVSMGPGRGPMGVGERKMKEPFFPLVVKVQSVKYPKMW